MPCRSVCKLSAARGPILLSLTWCGMCRRSQAGMRACRTPSPTFYPKRNRFHDTHSLSIVIPGERPKARDPGPKTPGFALSLMPGYLGPGSARRGEPSGMTFETPEKDPMRYLFTRSRFDSDVSGDQECLISPPMTA